jgi:hypothetical protein
MTTFRLSCPDGAQANEYARAEYREYYFRSLEGFAGLDQRRGRTGFAFFGPQYRCFWPYPGFHLYSLSLIWT